MSRCTGRPKRDASVHGSCLVPRAVQVGCAMGCKFCFTGKLGLLASLLPCQIVEQLVQARKVLEEADDPTPVSHVVYM